MAGCGWELSDPLYTAYHDHEWGVPVTDDRRFFEFLLLEGAQAGLSWLTILRRRESYREAFCEFDPSAVALWTSEDIAERLQNPAIIRNRAKIRAAVLNAQAFLRIQAQWGSFSRFFWRYTDWQVHVHEYQTLGEVPATSALSDMISRDLKSAGFQFVGPKICYAFCQATGMMMDHLITCERFAVLQHPKTVAWQ